MTRSFVFLMDAPEGTLQKLALSGIVTIHDLVKEGAKPVDRKNLATSTGLDQEEIYTLVKQADLQRIDGLEPADASLLVGVGIRSIADMASCIPEKLSQKLTQLSESGSGSLAPTISTLKKWKEIAETIKPVIATDSADIAQPGLTVANVSGAGIREEMFADMVEMITNLGRGISVAQQEMDEQAIRMQKLINSDQRLRNMGLTATWFTIPDATFNLKMNYTLVREQGAEHDAPAGRQKFLLTPLNAKTQNYFKLSEGMQSELNVRFASLPPPPQISQPITVPSVIGMTLEAAKEALIEASLRAGTVSTSPEASAEGKTTEVAEQIPAPGSDARFQDRINLIIRRAAVSPA